MAEGATLVLNKNITEETIVLTGKKLVIANGVEVTEGMLKMEEGAFIENKSGKDLSVIVLGDEEKTVVVKNDEVFDGKVEEPSKPTDPVDLKNLLILKNLKTLKILKNLKIQASIILKLSMV